jgi:cobalt-zinc-cadmium efflux system outer membrane protein
MKFRHYFIQSSLVVVPTFVIGCGTLGTYYAKTELPNPPQTSRELVDVKESTSIADTKNSLGDVRANDIPLDVQKTFIENSDTPIKLAAEILPVDFESSSSSTYEASYLREPEGLPLPEPEESTEHGESQSVGLPELVELALKHNPSIQQASATAHKASGLRTQVGLKPNPLIGYFGEEMGSDSSAGLQGAFVSQTFITGGKLEANRRVLDQDYQSILWEVETQRYRVRTDVRIRFYEALAAQRRLELAKNFLAVATKGRDLAQERFDVQEGARPDVLQSEIQLSEIEIIRQRAAVEYQAAWNALVAVVGLTEMTPRRLRGQLPEQLDEKDFETLYQELLNTSPELQTAYARLNTARAQMKRQDIQAIPNITGQLGVGRDNGIGENFANVQLSLPLPIHNRNQGNIQAAYADYCRASQDVARLKLAIRSRLVNALRTYHQSLVSVNQYASTILPKSQESMNLSEQAYIAGEFDFLRVLVARRTYFETNLSYVQARADLAIANARIEGLLLSGGLTAPVEYGRDDSLRGQALSGQ